MQAGVGSEPRCGLLNRRGQRALAQCRLMPTKLVQQVATEVLTAAAASLGCLAANDPYDVDATIPSRFGPVIASFESHEHCDWDFPRWTVLLVLGASRHHRISTAGRSYRLRAGDVVLFDAHRPHALDWAGAKSAERRGTRRPFVALHLEFVTRPGTAALAVALADRLGVEPRTVQFGSTRRPPCWPVIPAPIEDDEIAAWEKGRA